MARKRRTDFTYTANGNGEVTAEKLSRDTFPTDYVIARAGVRALELPFDRNHALRVLDAGAGDTGVWGLCFKELYPNVELIGCEIRDVPKPEGYDNWIMGDFTKIDGVYDVILGNIPFSLAEAFIWHSLDILSPEGRAIFLLRAQFNGGQDRYREFWSRVPLESEYYCASRMPFITKQNKKTGRWEPASDVWDYSLFQFAPSWRQRWWKTYRWDYNNSPRQFPLFLDDPLAR